MADQNFLTVGFRSKVSSAQKVDPSTLRPGIYEADFVIVGDKKTGLVISGLRLNNL